MSGLTKENVPFLGDAILKMLGTWHEFPVREVAVLEAPGLDGHVGESNARLLLRALEYEGLAENRASIWRGTPAAVLLHGLRTTILAGCRFTPHTIIRYSPTMDRFTLRQSLEAFESLHKRVFLMDAPETPRQPAPHMDLPYLLGSREVLNLTLVT